VVAVATVVSPMTQMEFNKVYTAINAQLAEVMQVGADDEMAENEKEQRLSIKKSKQKTSFGEVTSSKPTAKPKAKSVKTSINAHTHRHLRMIVKASIKLSGATPV
jgi:hypothetical protein